MANAYFTLLTKHFNKIKFNNFFYFLLLLLLIFFLIGYMLYSVYVLVFISLLLRHGYSHDSKNCCPFVQSSQQDGFSIWTYIYLIFQSRPVLSKFPFHFWVLVDACSLQHYPLFPVLDTGQLPA